MRQHKGLAWFPIISASGEIEWQRNPNYNKCELIIKSPEQYQQFGIEKGKPIYTQFEENPDKFLFVPHPQTVKDLWQEFIP